MEKLKKRNTLYLGERDKDIIDVVEPLLERYDFSSIIRELVRDGIKYRQGVVLQSNTFPVAPQEEVLQSNTHLIKKKEISDDELEERLDF
jgi:hypothetical protein